MHRPPVPEFPAMARHDAIPMVEQFRHSSEGFPSGPFPDHRFSSLGHPLGPSDLNRPNMVFSGHRRFRSFANSPTGNMESDANKIVEKLEENGDLMADTAVSEQLRKEALRDLPECLTMKRCVKAKLSKSVSQKSRRNPLGSWKRFKYWVNIGYYKFVRSVRNFNYFQLWHGSLKDIEARFGSGYASYFKFLRWQFVMNFVVALLSLGFIVVPQVIYDTSGDTRTTNTTYFEFKNIFVGDGVFLDTVLYYGHYTNETFSAIPHAYFDMPVAYFSVAVLLYLVSFIVVAVSVAETYRRNFIETEGGLQNVYANRVFCGWDYGIATKEAAELKSSSLYYELKELLSDDIKDMEEKTCRYRFWTITIQIVVNLLVLVILAAVSWLTWLSLNQALDEDLYTVSDFSVITAVMVNVIIMVFPSIFNYISKHEDYTNPRIALYITLLRTYLLGGVIIGTILGFWFTKANHLYCWENFLAADIYRLLIFDFIFSIIISTSIDVGFFVGRYFMGREPKTEFNIAKNTLQVIYDQGLFWVGFFYSPILACIVTIKMFIVWYVREGCVHRLCRPPKRTWRAAQAQTWFKMMTFLSILLIIAVHGYTLTSVQSSTNCGPFKHYNYTYEILTRNLQLLEQNEGWDIVLNVTKPGGVALIIIALCILVYYFKEQAYANREKVKLLRETLAWMARDKKFLVNMYKDFLQTESHQREQENAYAGPSRRQTPQYVGGYSGSMDDEIMARFKTYR